MKKRRLIGLAGAILAMALCLTACGSSSYDSARSSSVTSGSSKSSNSYATESAMADYYEAPASAEWGTDYESSTANEADTPNTVDTSRKLIKTVNLNVETKEFDSLIAGVETRLNELGGYIESSNINNGSRYYYGDYRNSRSASITIRVPQKHLDAFVKEISEGSYVTYKSSNVQDVTLEYVDVESRKSALLTEQERLLELLERADTMEDILTIEDRLTNIRYQLESQERQLRSYDNKVDYSTIYLSVDEVIEYTPVEVEEPTVWERIRDGFTESLLSVWEGIVNFIVWFIVKLPYLVIWGVIVFAIVFGIVRGTSQSPKALQRRAARKAKKEAKRLKKQQEKAAKTGVPVPPAATAPAEKKNEEN
jgi:hypothetical protein